MKVYLVSLVKYTMYEGNEERLLKVFSSLDKAEAFLISVLTNSNQEWAPTEYLGDEVFKVNRTHWNDENPSEVDEQYGLHGFEDEVFFHIIGHTVE